jgi:signal transduction histidine kinase
MKKFFKKFIGHSLEGTILLVLVILFATVLIAGWGAAMKLRQTVAANADVMNVDSGALIEVERLRNLTESQIANSRAFFLLGSKSIFDKQKSDKQRLTEELPNFEKKHSLPQIHDISKSIEKIEQQEQEFFDQAMEFRAKQTESKIVAQFYQSKTNPLIAQLNEKFDQIVKLQNSDLEEARNRAKAAGLQAQAQIPKGMTWFTSALAALFLCVTLLVVRMLSVRRFHLRERERLVDEAKKAIIARDEVIAATSQDLKEPLSALNDIAASLEQARSHQEIAEHAALIKGTVIELQGLIDDIYDQKKSDMGNLALRLEQLAVGDIINDAEVMLQPLAKQRDITLQFDSVNQTILAYVDRERVLRVLSNLIGNAIKFSRKHSRVAIKVKSDAQFVNISVVDNGPGLPENRLSELFDHFWQARKTSDQGAGVGLAIVKTIIEAHGGSVRAENSNIGQGSTFTFSLPRRRPVGAQLKKPSSSGVRRIARVQPAAENQDGPPL